jgi:hypothetical protein
VRCRAPYPTLRQYFGCYHLALCPCLRAISRFVNERLGRSEKAVLSVLTACACGRPARPKSADSELFIPIDKSSKNYSPVLFLSSAEGTGRVVSGMAIKDAFALEQRLFPSATSGYWASSIDVAKNAAGPKVQAIASMKLTMSLEGTDGKPHEIPLTFP